MTFHEILPKTEDEAPRLDVVMNQEQELNIAGLGQSIIDLVGYGARRGYHMKSNPGFELTTRQKQDGKRKLTHAMVDIAETGEIISAEASYDLLSSHDKQAHKVKAAFFAFEPDSYDIDRRGRITDKSLRNQYPSYFYIEGYESFESELIEAPNQEQTIEDLRLSGTHKPFESNDWSIRYIEENKESRGGQSLIEILKLTVERLKEVNS